MRLSLWFGVVICAVTFASAQTNSKPVASTRKAARKSVTVSAEEISTLRSALAAQQRQTEQQPEQMDQLKAQLQQLVDTSQQANATAQKAQSSVDQAQTAATQAQQSASEAQRV